jgi:inosine-uridine nucleoside N-ribohydrolase
MSNTRKVILDTDIGSDIDDAVALAYLLAQPLCELLGITTVSGQPEQRAMMASAQCKAAGKDVPIFAGAADPLIVENRQPKAPQADMLSRWTHDADYSHGQAISFLQRTIRQHPGDVTLFAIGPLTNIALLFKTDPEIPSLLKEFVIMGGEFSEPPYVNWRGGLWEWNIFCDPHAAAIVFGSGAPLRAIGTNVTRRVSMGAADVRARFQRHRLLHPVADFADVWFRDGHSSIWFHDPLAAAVLFDDTICAYADTHVTVELADDTNHARTYYNLATPGPHRIATDVHVERFFEHYFSVFDD